MVKEKDRDLTNLEYYVLGVISVEPQSGYSIINYFDDATWRSSTSPGSIYPILKRLEKQGIIAGELEIVQDARARKIYTLTEQGDDTLNEWLDAPVRHEDLFGDRAALMMKFVFMERRLAKANIINWLDSYEEAAGHYIKLLQINRMPELDVWSLHKRLILEAEIMELNMQRSWVQMARMRIQTEVEA